MNEIPHSVQWQRTDRSEIRVLHITYKYIVELAERFDRFLKWNQNKASNKNKTNIEICSHQQKNKTYHWNECFHTNPFDSAIFYKSILWESHKLYPSFSSRLFSFSVSYSFFHCAFFYFLFSFIVRVYNWFAL